MRRPILLTLATFALAGSASNLLAHGIPIDLLANSVTNRLFIIDNFEPGELTLNSGIEISTSSPGFGVNFVSNGIAPSTAFDLEISQELLYWDGTGLASPTVDMWVFNPAFTAQYTVTATSGEQTGMSWATYPGGSFWDAHGLYRLSSLSAPAGIYGLAVRVASPSYDSTKPFLLPLIYDPGSQWNTSEIAAGIDLLQAAVAVPFNANFDGDSDVDGADFLAWQRGFGPVSQLTTPADGDADPDSDVDHSDLQFWEQSFGVPPSSGFSSPITVPEPSSILLAFAACFAVSAVGRRRSTMVRKQECRIATTRIPILDQ